ncbi:AMP-binding protein [Balneatrix alpica]|uniref:AMP-binding protein n=1 Tax=Balneatrix alpica TaxID=75684 RepID=UPI0027384F28|nr:AMP-binding protein [Balneatrix alpica]
MSTLAAAGSIQDWSSINFEGFTHIPQVLERASQKYGQRPAFTCFGHTLSYQELDRLSAAFAAYLQHFTDLQPGDRIAIQLPNLLQYPVAVFGAMRAGLVVVNTNPLYTSREMAHQFKDSGAKALVIYASMAAKAQEILDETDIRYIFTTQIGDLHPAPKRWILNAVVRYVKKMEPPYSLPSEVNFLTALRKGGQHNYTLVEKGLDDVAVLQYTGGTTGVAKGAMLTHANLIANMQQARDRFGKGLEGESLTFIAPLPLYHIYAYTMHCMVMMATGNHSVLIANPRDIPGFIKELKKWRFDGFVGLNTLFVALCNHPEFSKLDFSKLKYTSSGGMALTHAAAERWQEITGCEVLEGYGLTETSPVVSFNPPGANQLGTIGKPLAFTQVRLIDPAGNDVPEGTPGEMCVRGPQVMKGYWQREQETRSSFTQDGYFRTGDVAIIQADGYMKIVDRRKDMIIVSGFNVYPNEVEDIVVSNPAILECAAIGVPDEKSGEAIKIFVVLKEGCSISDAELKTFCRERLTAYKVPKFVEFRDELPKSNVGKVLRRALREPATDSSAAA